MKATAGPELVPLAPAQGSSCDSPAPSQAEDRQKLVWITKGILLTCHVALG